MVKVLTRQNEDLQQQVEQKNVHIIELQERVITLEESTISSVSDLDKLTTAVQTSISLPSSKLWERNCEQLYKKLILLFYRSAGWNASGSRKMV